MSLRRVLLSFLLLGSSAITSAKTDSWVQVTTPHFIVLSDSNEKQARHVAGQFERMRAVFQKQLPRARVDAASPIIVLAMKDKKGFQDLEPAAYLARGQAELAGLFLRTPDKNYVLLRLDAEGEHPFATVYHEYTHFVMSRADWMPLWLNEGLAQFYENTDIGDKDVGLGKPSSENILLLRQKHLLPLSQLFAVDHNSPYYHEENKTSIFYAESWALTHYLEINDIQHNTQHLSEYLKMVGDKVDAVTAASRVFGNLDDLQKVLEKYVAQMSFFYLKMPGATQVDDASFELQGITLSQADTVRADFLAYNQRVKDSRAVLDRLLQENPNNVSACETMGYLAFRENKLDEGAKWYEQAVKLDSQSYLAQFYFAAISMREGAPSAERSARVESSLRAAIKLNPKFAPAYDLLASFYQMQRKNLDEALMLNLNAVTLDGGNMNFWLNRSNILMVMERPKDAVVVLNTALKFASDPAEVASIQNQINSIQVYQEGHDRAEAYNEAARERMQAQVAAEESENQAREKEYDKEQQDDARPELSHRGPRRTVNGTLRDVLCSGTANMKLKVQGGAKPVQLGVRNYFKVEYSALNFTPGPDMNPCKDLEGMKAKVEYFEAADPSADGQIISIQVAK